MDLTKGWIRLHRSILDNWVWDDKPFSYGQAWTTLLILANHADNKALFNGDVVVVKRGTFITSYYKLSELFGWSRKKTTRFFELLEKDGMVTTERTAKGTTVTLVNYDIYQCCGTTDDTTKGTTKDTTGVTTEELLTHTNNNVRIKECNKYINNMGADAQEEKPKSKAFVPPTVEEVRAYCVERNNNVDAEQFVDFYTSKNWFVGKNKMKDWKASVRTWERERKNTKTSTPAKPTNKFNDFPQRGYDFGSLEKTLMGG